MKLTNPESIKDSEKEFIDTINAELDWDAIEQLLLEKHGFSVQEEVTYKDGNLIVHGDQIAYKFDFEIKVPLSVIFNRNGECLEISTRESEDVSEESEEPDLAEISFDLDENDLDDKKADQERSALPKDGPVSKMASEIAEMISEINEQGGD